MTREEAIQWLKVINTKKFGWDKFALQESQREIRERCEQGVREAIDMAIEALSAPTCGDLINRQDAIDAIIAEGRTVDSRYLESERIVHECDAVEALAMLPSARPTGEWEELFMDNNDPEQPSHYRCSCCKNVWNAYFIPYTWKFCPHCGAHMLQGGDTE